MKIIKQILVIKLCILGLLMSISSQASHHIDCSDPINSIFPECKNIANPETPEVVPPKVIQTYTAACIATIDLTTYQIKLDWLDLVDTSGAMTSLKDVVFNYKSGVVFTFISAVPVADGSIKPEDLNCQNAFNLNNLKLSIPALKARYSDRASFENLLFSYQSDLDFALEFIEEVK